MRLICLGICLLLNNIIFSQNIIESYIFDNNNKPIVYASVYNVSAHLGSISNDKGFFRIGYHKETDTVYVSHLAYERKVLTISDIKNQNKLVLKGNVYSISSVNIYRKYPRNKLFRDLFKLFKENKKRKYFLESKANFIAESYIDGLPLERLEAIGNLKYNSENPSLFQTVMGRFGQNKSFNFFTLAANGLLHKLSPYSNKFNFPKKITDLSLRKMIRNYSLEVVRDNNQLRIIRFTAKKEDYFSGEVEYNKKTHDIVRLNFKIDSSSNIGFQPVNEKDKLELSDFEYTLKFSAPNYRLIDIIINYNFKYITPSQYYNISSDIIIFPTVYDKVFPLPFSVKLYENNIYSYIVNAPFDTLFWHKYYLENTNTLSYTSNFFKKEGFVTDYAFLKSDSIYNFLKLNNRLYQEKRLVVRDLNKKTDIHRNKVKEELNVLPSDLYHLELNYVLYPLDSFFVTRTILNLSESFFLLKTTINTEVALNIYIDIFEKNRIELNKKLQNIRRYDKAKCLLLDCYKKSLQEAQFFFRSSGRGENVNVLEEWNDLIYKTLRYDNIDLIYNGAPLLDNKRYNVETKIDFYNIGTIFLKKKKFKKAIFFFNKELSLNSSFLGTLELCNLYVNIGIAYEKMDAFDKACQYFKKAGDIGDDNAKKYWIKSCQRD